MNKFKAVISKIKLKDYEKQWLLSWAGDILLMIVIAWIFTPQSSATIIGVFALIWFIWTLINVCGLLYCIGRFISDWVENLSSESRIVRVMNWFSSSDR